MWMDPGRGSWTSAPSSRRTSAYLGSRSRSPSPDCHPKLRWGGDRRSRRKHAHERTFTSGDRDRCGRRNRQDYGPRLRHQTATMQKRAAPTSGAASSRVAAEDDPPGGTPIAEEPSLRCRQWLSQIHRNAPSPVTACRSRARQPPCNGALRPTRAHRRISTTTADANATVVRARLTAPGCTRFRAARR
jgi:hypothetical protein